MLRVRRNNDVQWITIFISIMPLLDTYELKSIPISFGEVGLIVVVIYTLAYFIVNKRMLVISNKIYIFFLIYSFITSLVVGALNDYFLFSEWIFKWGRILLYSYTFLTISYVFIDIDLLADCFCKIGIMTSVFEILQFISWHIWHKAFFLLIPVFKLHYITSDYSVYVQHLMRWNGSGWRPSNFFLEPTQYGIYASFALVISLFYFKEKRIKIAMLISLGIVVSGSATAIILVGLIWGGWVFVYAKLKDNKVFFVTIVVIIAGACFLTTNNVIKEKLLYRIHTIGELGASTGSLRVLRGFYIFRQLCFEQKIFGSGMGNFQNFLISSGITTIFDTGLEVGNEYMNTFSYILNNTGLVGIIIFSIFVVKLFVKNRSEVVRVFLLVWLVMIMVTSNFLTSYYIIPLMFAISIGASAKHDQNKKIYRVCKEK